MIRNNLNKQHAETLDKFTQKQDVYPLFVKVKKWKEKNISVYTINVQNQYFLINKNRIMLRRNFQKNHDPSYINFKDSASDISTISDYMYMCHTKT